ncbi:MAG: diguanylate cyclase [Chloroflexi bacterium]|nr:diguanylate cyclase [Chloroflexota bacterium]
MHLAVYLLGSFQVRLDDHIVTAKFRTEKERSLLACLAVESGRTHTRSTLAELLWPGHSEQSARTSLRQALYGLRRVLGEKEGEAPFLILEGENVHFNPNSSYWLDTTAFSARIQAVSNHTHLHADTCPDCIAILQEAIDLYRGDFMFGFSLADVLEFREWVIIQREHYFRQLLSSLRTLTSAYYQQGDYQRANQYAIRQVHLAPLEESAHQQLMQLYHLTGNRSAALEQYESCRRLLAMELGVEPAEETTALYQEIKNGQSKRPERQAPRKPTSNLPVQLTSFIGRQAELEWFADHLAKPVCRLITVIGLGGVGKTRLVLQAADLNSHRFRDGVHFIALEGIHSRSELIATLGETIGLEFNPAVESRRQLLQFLQPLEILLILDYFDHLIDATELLMEMLRYAPGLRIIITSRQRLNYQAACLLELEGLPVPEDTFSNDELEKVMDFPSIALFLNRSQRSLLNFSPSKEALAHIARICQLVGGLPLGIELAAQKLRTYSSQQIVQELAVDLHFLSTSLEDVPDRHRDPWAIFYDSRKSLTPVEQQLFDRLSVIRGSFSLEAAQYIAGATLPALSQLVDKSLLLRKSPRQFAWHPLVRRYASSFLAQEPEAARQSAELHAHYYLGVLHKLVDDLQKTGLRLDVMEEIEGELENIRKALDWAIQNKSAAVAERVVDLQFYYEVRQDFDQPKPYFSPTASSPQPNEGLAAENLILTPALAGGSCCGRAAQFADANRASILSSAAGEIIDVNYQACQLIGNTREDLLGLRIEDILPAVSELPPGKDGDSFESQVDGAGRLAISVNVTYISILEENQPLGLYLLQEQREATASKEAGPTLHDPLTGLPNRSLFEQHLRDSLSKAASNAHQIAVVLLDLDHLKAINRKSGARRGDMLLKAVAERLKRCIREEDLLARVGSDEFALIIENRAGRMTVQQMAERLEAALAKPIQIDDQAILITASIGISFYPDCGDNMESLMRLADLAVDQAKAKNLKPRRNS